MVFITYVLFLTFVVLMIASIEKNKLGWAFLNFVGVMLCVVEFLYVL